MLSNHKKFDVMKIAQDERGVNIGEAKLLTATIPNDTVKRKKVGVQRYRLKPTFCSSCSPQGNRTPISRMKIWRPNR